MRENANLGHCTRLNLIECIAENNAISQAKPEFLLRRLLCQVLSTHYPNYPSQPVGCFIPSYCCIYQIKRSVNSDDLAMLSCQQPNYKCLHYKTVIC